MGRREGAAAGQQNLRDGEGDTGIAWGAAAKKEAAGWTNSRCRTSRDPAVEAAKQEERHERIIR